MCPLCDLQDAQRLMSGTGRLQDPISIRRHEEGIKQGVDTIKAKRQARLKELFEQEALQYEAELNAMGLSQCRIKE